MPSLGTLSGMIYVLVTLQTFNLCFEQQNRIRARCVNANAKETVVEFADILCSIKFNNYNTKNS